MEVKRDVINQGWLVLAVQSGGAIDAWNNQAKNGPNAAKELRIGDLIVAINGKEDCRSMMEDMRRNETLKFEMIRMQRDVVDTLLRECENDQRHFV